MKAMQPDVLNKIRSISFGGEGYPKIELKKLYDLFSKQSHIINVYGPTECTCICSSYELSDKDFDNLNGLPPLGTLNQNFDFCIENEFGKESSEGELILIGPNVSSGYFNDIERTNKSFITFTDSKHYQKRAYRTGDLVRIDKDIFYFIGRKDNQIKHMGYRIELEEIENAIMQLTNVKQTAVVYLRQNIAYGKIFAFIAYDGNKTDKDLLQDLKQFLPSYMIPFRLYIMDQLPKNANGKIDRQYLTKICQS